MPVFYDLVWLCMVPLTLRGSWTREMTVTCKSILPGLPSYALVTNLRPMRNYCQLRVWFRYDDSEKRPFV